MSSRSSCWIRAAGAVWMLAFLIWLPFEDTETWMALALSAGASGWLGLRGLASQSQPVHSLRTLAAGALLGAAAPLVAIALMALKSGLHAHGFGDFTARQLSMVIGLIPIGVVIGGAAGLVASWYSRRISGADDRT